MAAAILGLGRPTGVPYDPSAGRLGCFYRQDLHEQTGTGSRFPVSLRRIAEQISVGTRLLTSYQRSARDSGHLDDSKSTASSASEDVPSPMHLIRRGSPCNWFVVLLLFVFFYVTAQPILTCHTLRQADQLPSESHERW
ncbi:hypothetical protein PCASD_17295 [Puccinia coronata f. sp. avenae]|uniref:Uncharacterized protein n=1 Tax=Puccinia coronata f. sp. avenae TaxID=200324 RepID=A0A2N5T7G4_9BASI|nr:hypothetical protein PCASD_17295 [Puccinia coronata f. sp. avenae]